MKRRNFLAAVSSSVLAAAVLAACGDGAGAGAGGGTGGGNTDGIKGRESLRIGVAMPTKSSERWIADGNNLKKELEALGHTVDLQYAEDDIPTQVEQIDNMITTGAELLIIASIDGGALTTPLENAAANGIPVIAYDRLIRNSENVSYYASFDNYDVGVQMGTSLLQGLGIWDSEGKETDEKGPFNIEVFAGSPDDNNAPFFFNGAMDTLKPYLESGVLNIPSGQTDFETVAILRWQANTAQDRMENLITSTYSGGETIDGVLSPLDSMSVAIIGALQAAGYSKPYPTVTGQDADLLGIKSIVAEEQYSTIYKDTRKLAAATVDMVKAMVEGGEPEVNDTETYDNGVKVVPAYLLKSQIITKDNVNLLIDDGYYTAEEVGI